MKQTILSILCVLAMFSCKKDEAVVTTQDMIQGEWYLSNFSGGLAGWDCTFGDGAGGGYWTFTEDKLIIVEGMTNEGCHSSLSGTFDYSIESNGGKEYLKFDEGEMQITVTDTQINLDTDMPDGFQYVLRK